MLNSLRMHCECAGHFEKLALVCQVCGGIGLRATIECDPFLLQVGNPLFNGEHWLVKP